MVSVTGCMNADQVGLPDLFIFFHYDINLGSLFKSLKNLLGKKLITD